jgi:hypothetical protein
MGVRLGLTLRKEHRLRVSRKISGPKSNEVTGKGRRLRDEDLYELYSTLNVIRVIESRRMRWAGHVARIGATGEMYK